MKTFILSTLLTTLLPLVSAHARLRQPTPLGYGTLIPADNTYNKPLAPDGSDFPCKGMIGKADMTPVAKWQAGSKAFFEIQPNDAGPGVEGHLAAHSGGSCQVSLSFDEGKTFKVIHSFIGGCPRDTPLGSNIAGPNQTFVFDVPAETRGGNAIMAWSWLARTGNRGEFYMNCASVEIDGRGSSTLTDLPDMWLGEMTIGPIKQGMCASTERTVFDYPNPGKCVTEDLSNEGVKQGPKNSIDPSNTDFSMCKAPGSKDDVTPPPPPPVTTIVDPTYPSQTAAPTTSPVEERPPTETTPPPAGDYQDIELGGVVYECRPKAVYAMRRKL